MNRRSLASRVVRLTTCRRGWVVVLVCGLACVALAAIAAPTAAGGADALGQTIARETYDIAKLIVIVAGTSRWLVGSAVKAGIAAHKLENEPHPKCQPCFAQTGAFAQLETKVGILGERVDGLHERVASVEVRT